MTYGVVLFTLLVQGLTIAKVGRRVGVLGGQSVNFSELTSSLM